MNVTSPRIYFKRVGAGINSSKLLQLSGIGPFASLTECRHQAVFINENVGEKSPNHPLLSISMLPIPPRMGRPGAAIAYTIHNVYCRP